MSGRTRYVRRVRGVDHKRWQFIRWHEATAEWFYQTFILGDQSGEPLGLIQTE